MNSLTAIIQKGNDVYIAECSEVGTVSQGNTVEESLANLKEATELYLEEIRSGYVYKYNFVHSQNKSPLPAR
jgi:predicted RNase H-like HicB family nuclease